jgi:hypothetical protein
VTTEIVVGTIGNDQTICYGEIPAKITTIVPPSGVSIFYNKWQYSIDGTNWITIVGATTDSYQPIALTQTTYFKKIVTTAANGDVSTNIVQITVNPELTAPIIGDDQISCANSTPDPITIENITSVVYSYQWQKSTNGTIWTNISSATGSYYQPNQTESFCYYRVVATNNCGSMTSNKVSITINEDLQSNGIGESQTISYNSAPEKLTGDIPTGGTGSYTYQWQYSTNGTSWITISGATSDSYQPGALTKTTYFRRITSSGNCNSLTSNEVEIIVATKLLPGSIGTSQTICYNGTPTELQSTSATGGNGIYGYQWQKSTDGTNWTNIFGATSKNYQPSNVTQATQYRRQVTSGTDVAYSNSVTINVTTVVYEPVTNEKSFYCKGETVTINITSSLYTLYNWYDLNKSFLKNGTSVNVGQVNETMTYYVESVDNNGCKSILKTVSVNVDPVKADFTVNNSSINLGDAVHFIDKSTNATSYVWDFFDGDLIYSQSPWHYYNNVSGSTSSKSFNAQLTVTSANGCSDTKLAESIVTVNITTGVNDYQESKIILVQNPVVTEVRFETEKVIESIKVYSITGSLVKASNDQSSVIVNDLESGLYMVVVTTNDKQVQSFKIIKR